jgi:hypothetical protein
MVGICRMANLHPKTPHSLTGNAPRLRVPIFTYFLAPLGTLCCSRLDNTTQRSTEHTQLQPSTCQFFVFNYHTDFNLNITDYTFSFSFTHWADTWMLQTCFFMDNLFLYLSLLTSSTHLTTIHTHTPHIHRIIGVP